MKKKLTERNVITFGDIVYIIASGTAVIPHPIHHNYNVKIRWIAFTFPSNSWKIVHSYSEYFLKMTDYNEEKLYQKWKDKELIKHGTPLEDINLVQLLVPSTRRALLHYAPLVPALYY
jgi:hypothetical protein